LVIMGWARFEENRLPAQLDWLPSISLNKMLELDFRQAGPITPISVMEHTPVIVLAAAVDIVETKVRSRTVALGTVFKCYLNSLIPEVGEVYYKFKMKIF